MHKVIFLDRDGTINVSNDTWWKKETFQFLPGAPEALVQLRAANFKLAVVTNQGAIEHGTYTVQDVVELHDHAHRLLQPYKITFDAIAFCPHASPTVCDCRKPNIGMAKEIESQLGAIDYAQSWMVGDKESDVLFGQRVGTKTALIRSSFWDEGSWQSLTKDPDLVVDSLAEFADNIILGYSKNIEFDKKNWRTDKFLSVQGAFEAAAAARQEDKRLVTVNGSFDLLHAGHLDQLEEAKQQGDLLFIGINSDASVREGKGPDRPLIPEQARTAMLAALSCSDYVIIIDAPYSKVQDILIDTVQPHVHVNGPDYGAPETWIEWPVMQKYGTKGYSVRHRNDLSTSAIIDKICKS